MDCILLDGYIGTGPGVADATETEDLDVTIVSWPEHYTVSPHVNDEVDVVTIVLSGRGEATIDGEKHALRLGSILVIPKGAERAMRSQSVDFRYVNVHKRRRKLIPRI